MVEKTKTRSATKRQVALVLLLMAVIVDSLGWYVAPSFVPDVTVPVTEDSTINYYSSIGLPVVNVTMSIFFTAQASLSVNNPIHVRAVVLDASIQNLLTYYNQIAFTDAFATDVLNYKGDVPPFSTIPLIPNATGWLIAEGNFKWMHEGPSWSFFLPTGKTVKVRFVDVETGMPTVIVSPLSDTLTIQNAIMTTRLTFILIGFSILTTQAIWEAILKIKNPDNQEQKPLKPLGLWHQHKRDRKLRSQSPPAERV